MILPLGEIGDGEAESGILHEGLHPLMLFEDIGRALLPHLCICDYIIHLALQGFTNVSSRPKVHLRGRSGATVELEAGKLGSLSLRGIRADRLDEARRQGVPFEDALAMMRETVDEMEADEILDAQIDAVVRTS